MDLFQGMYTNVIERTQHIEQVNIVGGRYIREAKVRLLLLGADLSYVYPVVVLHFVVRTVFTQTVLLTILNVLNCVAK